MVEKQTLEWNNHPQQRWSKLTQTGEEQNEIKCIHIYTGDVLYNFVLFGCSHISVFFEIN